MLPERQSCLNAFQGAGEKDTPMNSIFPVISKLLSNYRTPRSHGRREPPVG